METRGSIAPGQYHGPVVNWNGGCRDRNAGTLGATSQSVHDRIHAREPTHDIDRWTVGTITEIAERDGHCVVTVDTDGTQVELVTTLAVRDLFVSRLAIDDGESPVGEQVWYRKKGGQ